MKIVHLYFLLTLSICTGCHGFKCYIIGKTDTEIQRDDKGKIILLKRINWKSDRIPYHWLNPIIVRTRIKKYSNNKIIEKSYEKKKSVHYDSWDYVILKSKRITWDENRRKSITKNRCNKKK